MGCCILAAMIVGQIIESWRRIKQVFGIATELYPDPYDSPPPVVFYDRLRGLLRKPALRVGLSLLLVSEASVAGWWLMTEHEAHLREVAGYMTSFFVQEQAPTDICSVR